MFLYYVQVIHVNLSDDICYKKGKKLYDIRIHIKTQHYKSLTSKSKSQGKLASKTAKQQSIPI